MQAQQASTPSSNGFLNPLAVLTQMSKPASQTPEGKSATQDQIAQTTAADTAQQDRAWKLWMFPPRMLLHKPPRPAKIPKPELLSRFTAFFQGQWAELMQRSRDNRPQSQQPPAAPQPTREPAADQRHTGPTHSTRGTVSGTASLGGRPASAWHHKRVEPTHRPGRTAPTTIRTSATRFAHLGTSIPNPAATSLAHHKPPKSPPGNNTRPQRLNSRHCEGSFG